MSAFRTLAEELQIRGNTIHLFGNHHNHFMHCVQSFEHLVKRDLEFPLWSRLEFNRWMSEEQTQCVMDSVVPLGRYQPPLECIYSSQLFVSFCKIRNPEEAADLCDRVQFHCKYLDDEIKNMANYNILLTIYSDWFNESDKQRYGFRLPHFRDAYKLVLEGNEPHLAYEWAQLHFSGIHDRENEQWVIKYRLLAPKIRDCLDRVHPLRIPLNGTHEGIDKNYRFPVFKTTAEVTELPWWEISFKESDTASWKSKPVPDVKSCARGPGFTVSVTDSSSSESVLSTRERLERERKIERWDRERKLNSNQQAAKRILQLNKISSDELARMDVPYVTLDIDDCFEYEYKTREGQPTSRKTNLTPGGVYHCLRLTYTRNNEWLVTPECCCFLSIPSVALRGASREGIVGATCEQPRTNGRTFFKQYRDPNKHELKNYIEDVRTHHVVDYYADRFENLNPDREVILTSLGVDLILVFSENNERKTISEFMTAEVFIDDTRLPESEYTKFTSNRDYKAQNADTSLAEAFTHFTYQDSGGVLMVTDIQGIYLDRPPHSVFFLTDPAIHSIPGLCGFFRHFNCEEKGMQEFWDKVHTECNHICRKLGLKRPE